MFKEKAEEILAIGLFNGMVMGLEERLNASSLKSQILYDCEALNKSLKSSFDQIVEVLQSVVDKFYWSKYDIEGFLPFSSEDFDTTLAHNLELIANCKKLLKFID